MSESEMSESKSDRQLSPIAAARKEEMLAGLQGDLALFHRRRKRKRIIAGSITVGAMVLVVAIALLNFSDENNVVRPNNIAKQHIAPDQPLIRTSSSVIEIVNNNQNVIEKYTVRKSKNTLTLETVDDEELLTLLAASGNPSFLAEIDGKLHLIPKNRPARN